MKCLKNRSQWFSTMFLSSGSSDVPLWPGSSYVTLAKWHKSCWVMSICYGSFCSPDQCVGRLLYCRVTIFALTNKPSVGRYTLSSKGLGHCTGTLMEKAAEGNFEKWLKFWLCHSLAMWSWANHLAIQIHLSSSVEWSIFQCHQEDKYVKCLALRRPCTNFSALLISYLHLLKVTVEQLVCWSHYCFQCYEWMSRTGKSCSGMPMARSRKHLAIEAQWETLELSLEMPGAGSGKERKMKSLSHVWLFATPWSVAYQAPPSMEFSRQGYWSGLPFLSPGDLPDSGPSQP